MLDWLRKTAKLASNNIETTAADRLIWDGTTDESAALQTLQDEGEQVVGTWPPLMQDVFASFYKPEPALRPEDAVEPAHLANRPLVEAVREEPGTEQTRSFTMLDPTLSAVATLEATRKMLETVRKDQELSQAMNQFQQAAQQAAPGSGPRGGGGGSSQTQQALDQAGQQLQQAMHNAKPVLQKAARQGVRAGMQAAENAQQAMIGWGLDPGTIQRVPLGDRLELALTLSTERFRRMGQLIGRMRNLGRAAQAQKMRHQADEIHSIATGNHLARVLPQELASLNHPLLKLDFGRKFIEGRLMEYEIRPRPKDAKGPMICLIDASGSMAGDPIEWAAAVGLALLDIARNQKRDFAAAYFRGPGSKLEAFCFPKNADYDARQVLQFATTGASGGTTFEEPLAWALQVQEEAEFKSADIVMITDGECEVSGEFRERLLQTKRARDMRVFSFLIGGMPEELTRWSDRVWAIGGPDDLAAGELFSDL